MYENYVVALVFGRIIVFFIKYNYFMFTHSFSAPTHKLILPSTFSQHVLHRRFGFGQDGLDGHVILQFQPQNGCIILDFKKFLFIQIIFSVKYKQSY